jgi:hypothetical protein
MTRIVATAEYNDTWAGWVKINLYRNPRNKRPLYWQDVRGQNARQSSFKDASIVIGIAKRSPFFRNVIEVAR